MTNLHEDCKGNGCCSTGRVIRAVPPIKIPILIKQRQRRPHDNLAIAEDVRG